ncbi:hypothetical protein LQ772_11420 [Frateuria edaphi]|uniref:hypothetical protein n=1 Tax=Frateuria edaphi TaxID=2898793 RepID=UPI001E41A594|nr:hypothetical protein [Frateuria edaphi]UGB44597.1 hypothetical protein LQ772_11420 [Frateuria edaphi]
MTNGGRIRWTWRVALVLVAFALAWPAWLRPVGPRVGPVPASLGGDWPVAAPATQGLDDRTLEKASRALLDGLRMRPRDLLKIGRLVLDHGQWHGRQLVPAAWIERSLRPQLATGVSDFRYGAQWWAGTVQWHGRPIAWHAAFGNGGQRLFVVPQLDLSIVTTAGAYDELPTAIAVNRLVQGVVASVRE